MRYKGRSSLEFFFSFQRNIWGVSRAGDIVVLASDIQAWARPCLEIGDRDEEWYLLLARFLLSVLHGLI